jgi:subtilisin family serine protease
MHPAKFPRLFITAALLLATFLAAPAGASAQSSQPGGKFLSDEALVKFDPSTPPGAAAQCLRSANASRKRDLADLHVLRLQVPTGQADQAIARLRGCPGVLYAERNYEVSAVLDPNDPDYLIPLRQWGLVNIRAPQGWDLSTGSAAVTIAVVDSGIDLTHPDLAAKLVPGYDFVHLDTDPQDDYGHGTHVAGIAAASTNNGIGIAGVSWGARLMPVKVLNASGSGSMGAAAEGITWAADHGAQVINLSFGGTASSVPQTLQDAVNYAYGKGALVVAAAGNDAANENFYPAVLANVLSVTATDAANLKAGFANFGPMVDLAAPGAGIYSTLPGGLYGSLSGTSMAAPFVSGLAAILRGLPGNASPEQITQELQSTALDLGAPGKDDLYGYGLIQADSAIGSVHTMAVSRVGSGKVVSSPAGMDCGQTCLAGFVAGTSVTLTAVPFAGSTFLGWSDPACPGTAPCSLSLIANTSITARFTYALALPIIYR